MNRRNLILAVLVVIVLVEVLVRDDYAKVLGVHLDVLGGMSNKIALMTAAGRRPTPGDLTELVYPLDRARQFVGEYADQSERRSYAAFLELIESYQEFVLEIDAARGVPERWASLRPEVEGRVKSIQAGIERTRTALADET